VRRFLHRFHAIALVLLGLVAAAPAAWADYFSSFTELQQQMTAGKIVDAEQSATQLLADDPKNPLTGRVLSARARARLEQGHVSDAVADYLEAVKQADNGQRRANFFLELAAAMTRLGLGDHACAAIRQAVNAAGADDSPMGQLALARSRANGCPTFADKDFAQLFQLPFVLGANTTGTTLDSIFDGTVAIRFPSSWAILEASRAAGDSVVVRAQDGSAECAIRRAQGAIPIKTYIDTVSTETFTAGVRPGGRLRGVNGREGRMGSARAVGIDFGVGTLPGRLYVASRLDVTYSVLCLGRRPDTSANVRNTAQMISASMRWAS
jgi:hypothetical protein